MATSMCSVISFNGSEIETSTKSFTCSKKYVRKLLQFSIINIIYHRIELPEDIFEEDNVRDIKLMKCKKSSKHPLIFKFYEWMKGANHALERDYLKEFYFLFKNKDGVLGEYYKFKFYYNFNGVEEENRVDPNVLYEKTKQIFDEIKGLGRHKKWDERNFFTAQIKFTDNVAPSYQPPYYVNYTGDESDDEDQKAIKKIQKAKLFELTTGLHTIRCVCGGDTLFVNPVLPSTSSVISPTELQEEGQKKNTEEPVAPDNILINVPNSSSKTDNITENNTLSVFCLCQSTVSHKALKIIHCTTCKNPFHCVCFGFLDVPKTQFQCVTCGGSANIPDEVKEAAEKLFIGLRLLVGFCILTMEVPDEIMKGFPNVQERNELWEKLADLGVILKKNKRYIVNRTKLSDNSLLRMLFSKRTNADSREMVDLTEEDEEAGPLAKKSKS